VLQEGFPPQATGVRRRRAEGIPEGVSRPRRLACGVKSTWNKGLNVKLALMCTHAPLPRGLFT
jgi:hypothetical protein